MRLHETVFRVQQSPGSAYALPPSFKKGAFGGGLPLRFSYSDGAREHINQKAPFEKSCHGVNYDRGLLSPQRLTRSAAHSYGGLSPHPFPTREGEDTAKGLRPFTAYEKRTHPKRLLWQRGGAERAQWAMQRGESPVSKGALGSRSCGNAVRPLRTVGL